MEQSEKIICDLKFVKLTKHAITGLICLFILEVFYYFAFKIIGEYDPVVVISDCDFCMTVTSENLISPWYFLMDKIFPLSLILLYFSFIKIKYKNISTFVISSFIYFIFINILIHVLKWSISGSFI